MNQLLIFSIGSAGYGLLEILWRGYTHWTMLICGGICFFLIYHIFDILKNSPIPIKAAAGSLIITFVELVTGLIVNVKLGMNVWDYSNMPYNIYGQICLSYTLLWFAVCVPLIFFCKWLKNILPSDKYEKAC